MANPSQLPANPELSLPVVQLPTIEFDQAVVPNTMQLRNEFMTSNPELVRWLRLEASRAFPGSLAQREKAARLVLRALRLVERQSGTDALNRLYGASSTAPTEKPESQLLDQWLPPAT